jgi:hypothetical protein
VALPPGSGPIPVDGISPDTNPRLAEAAGELNAWIEYLLRPESHDGPRIYKPLRSPYPSEKETETQERMPYDTIYEQPEDYETLSVLEEFAGDTARFFRAAQAVSGIRTETIESAYLKLVDGVLTWSRPGDTRMPEPEVTGGSGKQQEPWPVPDMKYRDVTDTRINWVNMRKSWVAKEDLWAHEYERDFLDYQMRTENCLYAVAEHLVRYRAILHQAGEDILALMEALTRLCPRPSRAGETSLDLKSIILTGLVAVTTTVITAGSGGVTAAVLLSSAVVEMVGEAAKGAQRVPEKKLILNDSYHLRDVAKEYLKSVEQIEREVADALTDLGDSLRRRLDQIRQAREYAPYNGELTDEVPFFEHYRRP